MNAVPNRSAVNREQTTVRPSDSADPKKCRQKPDLPTNTRTASSRLPNRVVKPPTCPSKNPPSPRHGLYRKCPASASKAFSVGAAFFSELPTVFFLKMLYNCFAVSGVTTAMVQKLKVVDPSGLTDADWLTVERMSRAYEAGGLDAFWDELEKLQDAVLEIRLAAAFFPEVILELLIAHMEERGLTVEDLREVVRKAGSPPRHH